MERTVAEYIQICEWDTASYLIFSNNVFGKLVYYSHLLPLVVSLFLALFIFIKNPKSLSSRWFFITTILLSVWLFSDLVLWASEKPSLIMFFWSLLVLIEPIIYVGMLFFVYAIVDKKSLSFNKKLIALGLLLPTVILTPTSLAIKEFDLTNCWREAIEGNLAFYGYAIEVIFALWILGFGLKRFFQFKDKAERAKVFLVTTGAVFFLLSFAMGNVVGSLLVDWQIGQYGLFGIPVFVAMIAYLIVKYHVFNINLMATQLLVVTLWVLTLAILFLRSIETVQIVVFATLILFTILGYLFIKSVQTEVRQREELQVANKGQENLIHIMNHQIKGYLGKGKNIFNELLTDSDYALPESAKPMVDEGLRSMTEGVDFVQQVLKGSSAMSGQLVYTMNPLNFRSVAYVATEEMGELAKEKNLSIEFKSDAEEYKVVGDETQIREAVKNLISNSLNYTEHGGAKVCMKKSGRKVLLSVTDTGIGIVKEDMDRLFQKGGRGKDSLKYNVNSTGYGLAFVRGVVEAHKGRAWAESAGVGKGSTFYIELPLA